MRTNTAQEALTKIARLFGPTAIITASQISIPGSQSRYLRAEKVPTPRVVVMDYPNLIQTDSWMNRLPAKVS